MTEVRQGSIWMLGPCVFLVVASGQALNQSRTQLLTDRCKGSNSLAAAQLARMAALGGFAEFAANPVIGSLSDSAGCKPFLMLTPLVGSLPRMAVTFRPTHLVLSMERILNTMLITGFFTAMRASISDQLSGRALAGEGGVMAVWAGLGVVFGPLMESLILKRAGPRCVFLLVGLANGLMMAFFGCKLEESL